MTHFKQGFYKPVHPEKYVGDVNNIIYRSNWEKLVMHYMDNNAAVLKWSSEEIIIPYIFLEKKRRYFPDFYAEIVDKDNITTKYLIEVKPLKDTFVKMPKKMTPKAQKD